MRFGALPAVQILSLAPNRTIRRPGALAPIRDDAGGSGETSRGCSHLAMRGTAPKAIQELAGHSTLSMTPRYMHLAPSALREAIGLLNDFGQPAGNAEAATG